jgi:spore germination protein KC
MKMSKVLLTILLVATSTLTTGCWDRIEIEERGTILALAIDPLSKPVKENITGPQAKSDAPGYKLTAQFAIPGRIPLGPGEGGAGGAAGQKPVWLVTATGKTIDDAMNTLQMELAERVFLGHLRIIIVNQSLAETAGLNDILDFFRRNAEIRRLAWLLISKDNALDAMQASPKLERVPTLYMVSTMDHSVELGKIPNIFLGNFWTALSSKGQEPILPYISVRGRDQIKMEGLAVFHGDKMVSSMTPLEVAGFMEMRNEQKAGYGLALPVPGDPSHSVIAKGTKRKTKIRMHREQGKPVFDVYSRVEVNVEERTGTKPVDAVFNKLSAEATSMAIQGQEQTLKKMQDLHSDVFGFGELVRGKYPAYWSTIKTREKWDEEFSRLPVHLHCRVYIRRAGMTMH